MRNPTERFSDRVDNYVRFRPSYPAALFDYLEEAGLIPPFGDISDGEGTTDGTTTFSAADVGAGTGLFTALLAERVAKRGGRVAAVEPNDDMRAAAIRHCANLRNVDFFPGTAEATGLRAASVRLVTVAQAFHWFDPLRATAEFARILAPGGRFALVWNNRLCDTPFLGEYDRLVSTYAREYRDVTHRNVDAETLKPLFAGDWAYREFGYEQRFDLAGVTGRALSSSYCPTEGQPGHAEIMEGIETAFYRFAEGGTVPFRYRTELHYGSPRR